MTEEEADLFIGKMKQYGDAWDREEVLQEYGEMTLERAISDRLYDISEFSSITGMIIDEN